MHGNFRSVPRELKKKAKKGKTIFPLAPRAPSRRKGPVCLKPVKENLPACE